VYAKPTPRPKPQVRRKPNQSATDVDGGVAAPVAHPRTSSSVELPMPDQPPPPLPDHIDESVFAPLSYELNTNNNSNNSGSHNNSYHNQMAEEDDDYLTSF